MTKIFSLMFVVFIVMNSGCSEDSSPEAVLEIEATPSAKAADDGKSSGVYKGSFVGSSGYFKLILEANNISGVLVVDGKAYSLKTADITAADLGSSITDAVFKDESNTVTLLFSVNANGENPTVEIQITGHDSIVAGVSKELSTAQILIYEGFEYRPDIDHGVQCKVQISLILGADSAAWTAYETVDEFPLNNGSTGSCELLSGTGEYTYYIADSIIGVQYGNPWWIFSNVGHADFTEEEIYSVTSFKYDGFNYADSTRLIRKL